MEVVFKPPLPLCAVTPKLGIDLAMFSSRHTFGDVSFQAGPCLVNPTCMNGNGASPKSVGTLKFTFGMRNRSMQQSQMFFDLGVHLGTIADDARKDQAA